MKVEDISRVAIIGAGTMGASIFAVLREALHLVATGVVSPEDVDRPMRCGLGFRYPWVGPLQTADLGGLDVFYSVASYLFDALNRDTVSPASFKGLIDAGKLGIKTGEGFYKYETGSKDEILRKRDLYIHPPVEADSRHR